MYNMLTKVWLQSYQKQSNVIEKDVSTLPFFSERFIFFLVLFKKKMIDKMYICMFKHGWICSL